MSKSIRAAACGKVILFGEHAVVYHRPAIAVPVTQVRAVATIEPGDAGLVVRSQTTGEVVTVEEAPSTQPLAAIVQLTLRELQLARANLTISIDSSIPLASGLGSGAAVSAAIVRALAKWAGATLSEATINALVYEVEKLHHGTPSGVDNTVIVYQKPVYFVRGEPLETFGVAQPFAVAIGNTGLASPTKVTVGDVRQGWEADRARYETWFDQIGEIVRQARVAIEAGEIDRLGPLMNENQAVLEQLAVSSAELERLILAARRAGAAGAKLVGGGRGGNMIALVNADNEATVVAALRDAGAVSVLVSEVRG